MDVGRVSVCSATDDIAGNWSGAEGAHILVFCHRVSSVTMRLYHIWHHSSASRLLVSKSDISRVPDQESSLFLVVVVVVFFF
jgi:hypothetical protein